MTTTTQTFDQEVDDSLAAADDVLLAPGEVLKDELEARGWTQKDLADVMGRPTQAISEIVSGTKQIMPQTALELAEALGTSAELWTNLEADYRLSLARAAWHGDAISRRSRMYSLAPVAELVKRGWLRNAGDLAAELCRFLGIASLAETPAAPANFRASMDRGPDRAATIAWLKRVELLAGSQRVGPYDRDGLIDGLEEVAQLSCEPSRAAELVPMLARHGVHFVVVPHLGNTFLDGASFRMPSGSPVVAVTLRYDRIDSLWFTLMHEIGHVVLDHEGAADQLFPRATSEPDPDEMAASAFAEERLFPADRYGALGDALDFSPTMSMVVRAAAELRRHPGLLIGHLQFRGVLGYGQGRQSLVKVAPHLEELIDRAPKAA